MDLAQRHSAPVPAPVPVPAPARPVAAPAGTDRHATHRGAPHIGWRGILREPLRAGAWLRLAYLLLALPIGILCVPIALVGGPAGRIQRGLARRLLGVEVPDPGRTGPLALAHALISLPLNLIGLAVSGYFWT